MGDIIGNTQNFLAAVTTMTAGGDDDDDNDDPSLNFDLAAPFVLSVNVKPDLADQAAITAIQAVGSQFGQGVWGTGGATGIGVLGETDPAMVQPVRDMVTSISGVRGNSVGSHGVVGASAQGHGVFGRSASATSHSGIFGIGSVGVCGDGELPDAKQAKPRRIGVLGTTDGIDIALAVSGSDEAVRGYSVNGFALRGASQKNYAGVFATGLQIAKGKQVSVPAQTAQVRLVPATIPEPASSAQNDPNAQKFSGLAGDLLVLSMANGNATLWFCFHDGVNWKQIA